MKLGEKQELFSKLIATHILWLYEEGYSVRLGDTFRDPRLHGYFGERGPNDAGVAYGKAQSYHKLKLACDLNLFKDGKYLGKTSDHKASGKVWESRHPGCVWGGRFQDGNHYSLFEMRTTGGF